MSVQVKQLEGRMVKSRGSDSYSLPSSELPSGHDGASRSAGGRSGAAHGQSQQSSAPSTDGHTGIVVTVDAGPRDLDDAQRCFTDWQTVYSCEQPELSQMPVPVSVA